MRFLIVVLWFFTISVWGSIYEELEVDPSASQEEIKKEYRKMAQRYHPDKHPEGSDEQRAAEEIFKKKDEAFRILLDPERKRKHDDWIDSPEYEEWKSAKGDEGAVSGFNSSSFGSGVPQSGFDWGSVIREGGGTDLHRAFLSLEHESDVLKTVQSIVETGVDVNAEDNYGKTALYMAIRGMYIKVVKYLFEVRASPNISRANEIYEAVMRAVQYSHIGESVWRDPRKGSLIGKYHSKKEKRALEMFSLLRRHGMNLHLRGPLPSEEFQLPLELAVSWGYKTVALWIIEQEGIEYLTDEESDRIVRLAINKGQTKVVISLIRKLSEDGRSWKGGRNALIYAMMATPYFESDSVHSMDNEIFAWRIVTAVVETGVDVNAEDNYGRTALSMAIDQGYISVVKYLFRVGASHIPEADKIFSNKMYRYVFIGNGTNDRPEMRKVKRALKMFVLLGEHNVNLGLSKPLLSGELPLELVVERGYEKMALWIIEQEGVEYLTDEKRARIVSLAIDRGQAQVVRALRGASNANHPLAIVDNSQRNQDGRSPGFGRCLSRWFEKTRPSVN